MSKIYLISNIDVSRNKLIKSSSSGVNSLYEKYIDKISLNKKNPRIKQKDKNIRKNTTSKKNKKNVSQSSFNSFHKEEKNISKNNFHFHSFSKIIEKYFQQKNKEISYSRRKNNSNSKNLISESNRSNIFLINSKKNESVNIKIDKNKIKTSRNKNLSMREVESNIKSLKHTHNNFRKENIYPKKIFQFDSNLIIKRTSPNNKNDKNKNINFFNNENKNKKSRNKSNSIKKTDSNCSEVVEIENKYNILFNRDAKINNLNKGNFNDFENTKPNTLITKIEDLEGPELIQFSLIELIQKRKKKMEEISNNLNKKEKN